MIKFDEIVNQYSLYNSSGKDIDFIWKVILFTLKDIERNHKIVFEMVTQNPNLWIKLAVDAHEVFEKENLLIAEYRPCNEYPFYRVYCYEYTKPGALSREAFLSFLDNSLETEDDFTLHYRYKDTKLDEQYSLWEEKLIKRFAGLVNVSNGRIDNTKIEQTIILDRHPDGCIVCGQKASGYISSIIMREEAIFIIAHTCDKHQKLARQNPSFLHFISNLFQMGIDFPSFNMQDKIEKKLIDLIIIEIKRELECNLSKDPIYDEEEYTLTFKRNSGVIVILRLHTLMDYAYMVNKPNGEQFQRIDSAPDHKNIQFFPDHLHRTFTKVGKKHDVGSSYTFGFPLLDLPAIEKMINKLELEEGLI